MKYKAVEQLWEEVGFTPSLDNKEKYQDWFRGYAIAHFEQLYLKLRDVVCVNVNIFEYYQGFHFIGNCCEVYNCKVIHEDKGEIWVVRDDYELKDEIPSRFTDNPLDHKIRGRILNYPEEIIENYILLEEGNG